MGKKANKSGSDKREPAFEPRLLEAEASDALNALDEVGDKAADLVEIWIRSNSVATVAAVAASDAAPAAARKAARRVR